MSRRVLVMTLLVTACGGVRSHSVSTGVPFLISSYGGAQGVQGRLEGTIGLGERWLYLTATAGEIRTFQLDRQDYWDLRPRAAIVTCRGRDVEIASEGRAIRLLPLLGLSRDSSLIDTTSRALQGTLRLDVGVPPGLNAARSWVAVVFEWPFQNLMATYTLHTNVPAATAVRPWTGRQQESPAQRC